MCQVYSSRICLVKRKKNEHILPYMFVEYWESGCLPQQDMEHRFMLLFLLQLTQHTAKWIHKKNFFLNDIDTYFSSAEVEMLTMGMEYSKSTVLFFWLFYVFTHREVSCITLKKLVLLALSSVTSYHSVIEP